MKFDQKKIRVFDRRIISFFMFLFLFPFILSCEEDTIENNLWGVWNLNEEWDQSTYTWEYLSSMGRFYTASANSSTYEFNNLDMIMYVGEGEGRYPIISISSKEDTVYLEVTRQVSGYDDTKQWVLVSGIVAIHFISDNEMWIETIKEQSHPWFPGMLYGKEEFTFQRARKVK